ncbi:hypothetical protein J2S09_005391 [Bacillus fengqiuensis]|nr:hypothetical protein [Bacillus fengqiuensis]
MKIGQKVMYQGKSYKIIYIYEKGVCKLKKERDQLEIVMAHIDELEPIRDCYLN